ncbi:outer membrane assembly protein [Indibacter alkaliphilus LW1]|uniref:Outer membrane assembly protein n=1 Tax=Indibacter alkaliphilus (strain CCUG 57479 / KCTC 22604 / LW1) TaxID=1189612 RepID=S2E1E5_INDAL|nr:AsmA-like C-terminal region-containing protein [Indibacter alkaliphilus]EOZ98286.1 outer membrane assembly protein [Indibacter alkaliphilus LW1]
MKYKKIWIILSVFLFSLIVIPTIAVFLLYQNQKQLTQKAVEGLNESIHGELRIMDSHISPFKNFPYVSIDLEGLSLFEEKGQYSDTVLNVNDLYVGFRITDILSSNYTVKSIRLSSGKLNLVQPESGILNLLKAIETEQARSSESEALSLDLSSVLLDNVALSFDDFGSGTAIDAVLEKINAGFRIDQGLIFIEVAGDLIMDYLQDGEPTFFNDKHVNLGLSMNYDEGQSRVTIEKSNIKLEEALLGLSGSLLVGEGLDMDIRLFGEKPDFSLIAAFLPNETASILKRYKNEGDVFFNGTIKGKAGNGQVPEIAVEFGCDNAYFLNPSIDKKVDQLRFTGFFTNGKERSLKTSEFQLLNFNARPDEGVFQGRLVIRDFENPYVKINLNADLDLGFLGEFFEIEGLLGISGQVILNMDFDELIDLEGGIETISDVQNSLQSELIVKNLNFTIPELPYPVRQLNAYAMMKGGNMKLENLNFKILDSDFSLKGSFDDFPSLLHADNDPVKAKLEAKASKIDFGQLIPADTSLTEVLTDFSVKLAFESTGNDLRNFEYLPKGEFFIEDFYAKLNNYPHEFHDFDVDILIGDNSMEIIDFTGMIDASDFQFTGGIDNYSKWFKEKTEGKSNFSFELKSDRLIVKDLISYNGVNYLPEDYKDEIFSQVFVAGKVELNYEEVFKSADLYLDRLEGKMKLHPLKLEDFKGRVHYEEDYLTIEGLEGKMGSSDFRIDVGYLVGEPRVSKRNRFSIEAKSLDLDALMGFESIEKEVNHADSFNIFELPFSDMDFSAKIKKLNYHTFWLEDVVFNGRTTPNHYLYVDTLGLRAADGTLGIKGYFNGSDPEQIYFNSTMKAEKLDLDKLLIKFDNFGQDQLINENLHGLVSGIIKSNFLVHPDLTPIIEKSEASMNLTVYKGSLVNFAPLRAMGDYFKDKNMNLVRFDTLKNTFDLKEGVLNIPRMNINSSLGFIEISGKQSLDMNMDYFIRIPLALVTQVGFRSLFGGRSREEIDAEQEDEIVYRDPNSRVRFVNVTMKGTPDDFKIGLGKDKKK